MSARKDNSFEGIAAPLTYYRVNEGGLSANLNKQYSSWYNAINGLKAEIQSITPSILSLAKAYQLRYLARRAIQSGSAWSALKLVHKALLCNPKILIEETGRTTLTYACALLAIAPSFVYKPIENAAMRFVATRTAQSKA